MSAATSGCNAASVCPPATPPTPVPPAPPDPAGPPVVGVSPAPDAEAPPRPAAPAIAPLLVVLVVLGPPPFSPHPTCVKKTNARAIHPAVHEEPARMAV